MNYNGRLMIDNGRLVEYNIRAMHYDIWFIIHL